MSSEDAIEVRRYGTHGPTVVLLHGGPGAPGSVASLARELASAFRVLEPLQRRHGGAPLSVDLHVRDLAAIAPGRTVLVGWSWGAMLALSFAARHPERAHSLALIGCGTYDTASRATYQRAMDERLGPESRSRVNELRRHLEAETDPAERDRIFGEMADLVTRAQAFDPITTGEEDLQVDSRGHVETWQDVLRLQKKGVEPAAFAAIDAPVLMLHGDHDPHPGLATRDVLWRPIPHIEYVGFERCGHVPWLERHAREPFLVALQNRLMSTAS